MRRRIPTNRRSHAAEQARQHVLAHLAKEPRTGEQIRDDLAAKCGSKEAVGRALADLQRAGRIEHGPLKGEKSTRWRLVPTHETPMIEAP